MKHIEKEIGIQEILLIIGGLVFGLSVVFIILTEKMSDEELERTKHNCINLPIPHSFVKISDFDMVKSSSAVFSTQYSSDANPQTVEEHFTKLLVPQGWKYEPETNAGERDLRFYKGKSGITIGYPPTFTSNKRYSVSCYWRNSRHGLIGDLFQK